MTDLLAALLQGSPPGLLLVLAAIPVALLPQRLSQPAMLALPGKPPGPTATRSWRSSIHVADHAAATLPGVSGSRVLLVPPGRSPRRFGSARRIVSTIIRSTH